MDFVPVKIDKAKAMQDALHYWLKRVKISDLPDYELEQFQKAQTLATEEAMTEVTLLRASVSHRSAMKEIDDLKIEIHLLKLELAKARKQLNNNAAAAVVMAESYTRMADVAEMLWIVIANVSGSDWATQNPQWQEAAHRWRDAYFEVVRLNSVQ